MAKDTEIVKATQLETVTPNQLLALAVQTNADPDRLDKLMDLQLKWEANEARKCYIVAMANFRAKCPIINKTRNVDFPTSKGRTQYNHAGLSESIEQIKGLMSECGLSHSWRTTQSDQCITVECLVTHIEGHSEGTSLTASPDNTGGKNSIQAIASTVSYLERYTLFAMLGLASQDTDDDAEGAEKGKSKPDPETNVTAIVEQAYFDFTTEWQGDCADGFEYDLKLFKEQLWAIFKKDLSQVKREEFDWTDKEAVAKLVKKIKPDKVIKEIKNAASS